MSTNKNLINKLLRAWALPNEQKIETVKQVLDSFGSDATRTYSHLKPKDFKASQQVLLDQMADASEYLDRLPVQQPTTKFKLKTGFTQINKPGLYTKYRSLQEKLHQLSYKYDQTGFTLSQRAPRNVKQISQLLNKVEEAVSDLGRLNKAWADNYESVINYAERYLTAAEKQLGALGRRIQYSGVEPGISGLVTGPQKISINQTGGLQQLKNALASDNIAADTQYSRFWDLTVSKKHVPGSWKRPGGSNQYAEDIFAAFKEFQSVIKETGKFRDGTAAQLDLVVESDLWHGRNRKIVKIVGNDGGVKPAFTLRFPIEERGELSTAKGINSYSTGLIAPDGSGRFDRLQTVTSKNISAFRQYIKNIRHDLVADRPYAAIEEFYNHRILNPLLEQASIAGPGLKSVVESGKVHTPLGQLLAGQGSRYEYEKVMLPGWRSLQTLMSTTYRDINGWVPLDTEFTYEGMMTRALGSKGWEVTDKPVHMTQLAYSFVDEEGRSVERNIEIPFALNKKGKVRDKSLYEEWELFVRREVYPDDPKKADAHLKELTTKTFKKFKETAKGSGIYTHKDGRYFAENSYKAFLQLQNDLKASGNFFGFMGHALRADRNKMLQAINNLKKNQREKLTYLIDVLREGKAKPWRDIDTHHLAKVLYYGNAKKGYSAQSIFAQVYDIDFDVWRRDIMGFLDAKAINFDGKSPLSAALKQAQAPQRLLTPLENLENTFNIDSAKLYRTLQSEVYHRANLDYNLERMMVPAMVQEVQRRKLYDQKNLRVLEEAHRVSQNILFGRNMPFEQPIDVATDVNTMGDIFTRSPVTDPDYSGTYLSIPSSSQSQAAKLIGNIFPIETILFGQMDSNLARQHYQALYGHAVSPSIKDAITRHKLGPQVLGKDGRQMPVFLNRAMAQTQAMDAVIESWKENQFRASSKRSMFRDSSNIVVRPVVRIAYIDPRIASIEKEQFRLVQPLQKSLTSMHSRMQRHRLTRFRIKASDIDNTPFANLLENKFNIKNKAILNHFRLRKNFTVKQLVNVLNENPGSELHTSQELEPFHFEDMDEFLRTGKGRAGAYHIAPDSTVHTPVQGYPATNIPVSQIENKAPVFVNDVRIYKTTVAGKEYFNIDLDFKEMDRNAGASKLILGDKSNKVYSVATAGDINISHYLSGNYNKLAPYIVPEGIGGIAAMKVKKGEGGVFFNMQLNRMLDFINRTESNPVIRQRRIQKALEASIGDDVGRLMKVTDKAGLSLVDWGDIRQFRRSLDPGEAVVRMIKAFGYDEAAAKRDFMARHWTGQPGDNVFGQSREEVSRRFDTLYRKQKDLVLRQMKKDYPGLYDMLKDDYAPIYDIFMQKRNIQGGAIDAVLGSVITPDTVAVVESTTDFIKKYESINNIRSKLPALNESHLSGYQALYLMNQMRQAGKRSNLYDGFFRNAATHYQLADGSKPLEDFFKAGSLALQHLRSVGGDTRYMSGVEKADYDRLMKEIVKDLDAPTVTQFVSKVNKSIAGSENFRLEQKLLEMTKFATGSEKQTLEQLLKDLSDESTKSFFISKEDYYSSGISDLMTKAGKSDSMVYRLHSAHDVESIFGSLQTKYGKKLNKDLVAKARKHLELVNPHNELIAYLKQARKHSRLQIKDAGFFKELDALEREFSGQAVLKDLLLPKPAHNLAPIEIDNHVLFSGSSLHFYNTLRLWDETQNVTAELNQLIKNNASAEEVALQVQKIAQMKTSVNSILSKHLAPMYADALKQGFSKMHHNFTPLKYAKIQNVHNLGKPMMNLLTDLRAREGSLTKKEIGVLKHLENLKDRDVKNFDKLDGLGFRGMGVGESLISKSYAMEIAEAEEKAIRKTGSANELKRFQRRKKKWLAGEGSFGSVFGREPGTVEMFAPEVRTYVAPNEIFNKPGFSPKQVQRAQSSMVYWEPMSLEIKGGDYDGDLGWRFFTRFYMDGGKNKLNWGQKRSMQLVKEGLVDGFGLSDFTEINGRLIYNKPVSDQGFNVIASRLGDLMPDNILNHTSANFISHIQKKTREVMALKLSVGYFGRLHNKMITAIGGADSIAEQVYRASTNIDTSLYSDVDQGILKQFREGFDFLNKEYTHLESVGYKLEQWHGKIVEQIGIKKDKSQRFMSDQITDRINEVYSQVRALMYSKDQKEIEGIVRSLVNDGDLKTVETLGKGGDKNLASQTLLSINRVFRGLHKFGPEFVGTEHSFLEKSPKALGAHIATAEILAKNPELVGFYEKNMISGTLKRAGISLADPFTRASVFADEAASVTSMFRSPMRGALEDAAASISQRITKYASLKASGLAALGMVLTGMAMQPSYNGNVDTFPDDFVKTIRTRLSNPGPGFIDRMVDAAFGDSPTPEKMDITNKGLPPRPKIRSVYSDRRLGSAKFRNSL